MGRNAFETAVEVRAEGFSGSQAVAEWMDRIGRNGQRYCALALDLLLVDDPGVGEAPAPALSAQSVEDSLISPLFDNEFAFNDVPGEPFVY